MSRRLLIRPGGIGDCINCFPAMEYLRAEYTEVWISRPVVPLVQFADRVVSIASTGLDLIGVGELPMPEWTRERLKSFDEVVSWYGAARPDFRRALESLGVKCTFLQALPGADWQQHAAEFFAGQVAAPPDLRPRVDVSRGQPRDTVVIHPFSGGRGKNWPLEHFREVAAGLPSVEWIAGPEEELDGAHRFEDLFELAGWMRGARLYIGNDSGITHLAAAIGMPVLALFGPTDPNVWAPEGANVMRSEPLSALPPCAVLETTQKMLARLSASSEESACGPR